MEFHRVHTNVHKLGGGGGGREEECVGGWGVGGGVDQVAVKTQMLQGKLGR